MRLMHTSLLAASMLAIAFAAPPTDTGAETLEKSTDDAALATDAQEVTTDDTGNLNETIDGTAPTGDSDDVISEDSDDGEADTSEDDSGLGDDEDGDD